MGYFIAQYFFNLGVNIKSVHTAVNLQQWPFGGSALGYNHQSLDSIHTWRINTFQPTTLAQMPASTKEEYLVELWPLPTINPAGACRSSPPFSHPTW